MNDRIKELAIEAGGGPSKWYTDPAVLEYFTELVVKECLVQIGDAIPDTDCSASGAYKTAKIAATSRVKQHFGVK